MDLSFEKNNIKKGDPGKREKYLIKKKFPMNKF